MKAGFGPRPAARFRSIRSAAALYAATPCIFDPPPRTSFLPRGALYLRDVRGEGAFRENTTDRCDRLVFGAGRADRSPCGDRFRASGRGTELRRSASVTHRLARVSA